MSLDDTQSTDVGGTPTATAGESTSADASSVVSQENASQTATAGDVTAQSVIEGSASEQEGATPPPAEDDILKDIPSVEELRQQAERKVPYSAALLQLRTALEARNGEYAELKGKLDPVEPLLQQHGGLESIQSRLEAYGKLFSPKLDQNDQPILDHNGLPQITTAPFIAEVAKDGRELVQALAFDALSHEIDLGNDQKLHVWQLHEVAEEVLKKYGLDVARLDEYRNIDALPAKSTGEITPEELESIPEEFRDTYKTLPPGVRSDLHAQDDETRRFNLEVYKERADRKAAEAQAREQQAQEREARAAEVRDHVAREQDGFVAQQLQEAHASIMDDLASKVTFSTDSAENQRMLAVVGSALLALRDPSTSFATEQLISSLGMKIEPSFYQALEDADKHLRDAKALELFGRKAQAQNSMTLANNAKTLALAKSSVIAVKIAEALGAQVKARAEARNGSLQGATTTRPTVGNAADVPAQGGLLPPGMLANSPEAGIYLARQAGLLGS